MRSESLVLRNSLWIGLQPLILNIVSIFVTGYIARTLGDEDYGRFIFAFAFVALLMPVADLGLRAVTVRDIAADREHGQQLVGRIFGLRLSLSVVAAVVAVVIINLMDYPYATRVVVYLAAITIVTKTAATTLFDFFQAYERMQYIAFANFISGTTLTVLSVVVLVVGFRLYGLTTVYVLGSAIMFVAIAVFYRRVFPRMKMVVDIGFWREALKKGLPFFIVGMLSIVNIRLGVVLLSKLGGDAAVGQYGAAYQFIERLAIISESLCVAIFPTLSLLFASSKMEDLNRVLGNYFNYMLIVGLPIAVGGSLLAPQIIGLIYGDTYAPAAAVMSVLVWGLPFLFVASLLGYTLGAVKLQPLVVKVAIATSAVNLLVIFVLIPRLQALGVAVGYLSVGVVSSVLLLWLCRKRLGFKVQLGKVAKIFVAAGVLALVVLGLERIHWVLAVGGGAAAYFVVLFALGAVDRNDLSLIKEAIRGRRKKRADSVEQEKNDE